MTEKEEKLVSLAQKWYEGHANEISDQEYDTLLNQVKEENPEFNLFDHIHLDGETVKHHVKFPELKKPQIDKYDLEKSSVKKLLDNLSGKGYVMTPKLSGCSVVVYYDEDGNLYDIITKSNDKNGKRKLKSLNQLVPKQVSKGIHAINCEAIVELDRGLGFMSEAKANGLINSKLKPSEVKKLITLVVWDIQLYDGYKDSKMDLYESLYKLVTEDFKVIHPKSFSVDNLTWSSKYEEDGIKSIIDGYVIYDKNHYLVTALKFYFNESANVTIKRISWNLSDKLGLIPKIHFDPVKLEEHTIKQCASNGIGMLKDRNLGKGSIVTIARVNSASPQIVNVVETKGFEYPKCPKCGTQLGKDDILGGVIYCSNPLCSDKVNFIKKKVGNPTSDDILSKMDKYTIDPMNLARYNKDSKRKSKWSEEDKSLIFELIESQDKDKFYEFLKNHFKFNEDNRSKVKLMIPSLLYVLHSKLYN